MEGDLGGEFIIGILDLELRSSSDVWKCKMRTGSLVYSIKGKRQIAYILRK